jgi:hypothetical protein
MQGAKDLFDPVGKTVRAPGDGAVVSFENKSRLGSRIVVQCSIVRNA